MIIRTALPGDASNWAEMLLQLDKEVEYTTFEPGERSADIIKYSSKISSMLEHPKSSIFLAFDNSLEENVIGYLSVDTHRNKRKEHVATIGIGVLKSHASQGIASQLLTKLMEHAKHHQLRRIEGHIAESNYKSLALATKFGFVTESIKKNAIKINGIYENEYLMVLDFTS